jgi:hypothetical protein
MSERKVLNKYIPPNFDPKNLSTVKRGPGIHKKVRLMAPFSMQCKTCGEFIYKGKKFNARKEFAHGEDYLGIQVSFVIKPFRELINILDISILHLLSTMCL